MNPHKTWLVWLCSLALMAAACSPSTTTQPTQTAPAAEAVYTAAAQTAEARRQQTASAPSPQPVATATGLVYTPVVVTVSASTAITPTAAVSLTPTPAGSDILAFVADVTVPDGTAFRPGEAFIKTWRVKNAGTATWTTAYSLVFVSGTQMGGPASQPLAADVPPGGEVDLSVNLTAPANAGAYLGFWMLRNAAGSNFGLGPNADTPFYLQISVTGAGTSGGATAPASSGSSVSGVSLIADNASVEGACPHTFYFVAQFSLKQTATASYRLEAETGFNLQLPAPSTIALGAGTHTVNYSLEFTGSLEGWVRFHVTAPEDVVSPQVNISLKCN